MRSSRRRMIGALAVLAPWLSLAAPGLAQDSAASSSRASGSNRVVLVELFTSQGCNMCPGADKLLSSLPGRGYHPSRVLVLAFHVDYFNKPWTDPFSKPDFSRRNMAYHQAFKARDKNAPDLYFTPMIMVSGKYPTSGYYHEGEQAAWDALKHRIDRSLRDPAEVSIEIASPTAPPEPGKATKTKEVRVRALSPKWIGRPLIVCAALAEDGLLTSVPSGENEGKNLVENHVVRSFEWKDVNLNRATPAEARFDLVLPDGAKPEKLRVVYFVQDPKSGLILQAFSEPWTG